MVPALKKGMSDENLEVIDVEKPKSKYDVIIKSKLV